jgi:mono/diheme cytochrome c family protein
MTNKTMRLSIAIAMSVGFLLAGINTQAYPPFMKASAKFGAKDCAFCHTKPAGGKGLTKRGKWLVAERDKRNANVIDVDWLSEYETASSSTAKPGSTWAEMDAFGELMTQTVTPAERGDFAPIRERSGDLAEKAKKWLDSKPPKACALPKVRSQLVSLSNDSRLLSESIAKGATDEQIKTALASLQKRNQEIVSACPPEKPKQD